MYSEEFLIELIKTIGLIGIVLVVFAESGLLFGFFLPGDSMLFTAGFLASQGCLDIYLLSSLTFIAAILGDNVGYTFGKKAGKKIFKKEDSLFFNKNYLIKAQQYYDKHGPKTIVIARFIPFVRTFAPIVAGAAEMKYKIFVTYNVLGAFLFTICVTWAGYFLGSMIPGVDKYMFPILTFIIIVTALPALKEYWQNRKEAKKNKEQNLVK